MPGPSHLSRPISRVPLSERLIVGVVGCGVDGLRHTTSVHVRNRKERHRKNRTKVEPVRTEPTHLPTKRRDPKTTTSGETTTESPVRIAVHAKKVISKSRKNGHSQLIADLTTPNV